MKEYSHPFQMVAQEVYFYDVNLNLCIVIRTTYIYQNPMHASTILIFLFISICVLKSIVLYIVLYVHDDDLIICLLSKPFQESLRKSSSVKF